MRDSIHVYVFRYEGKFYVCLRIYILRETLCMCMYLDIRETFMHACVFIYQERFMHVYVCIHERLYECVRVCKNICTQTVFFKIC